MNINLLPGHNKISLWGFEFNKCVSLSMFHFLEPFCMITKRSSTLHDHLFIMECLHLPSFLFKSSWMLFCHSKKEQWRWWCTVEGHLETVVCSGWPLFSPLFPSTSLFSLFFLIMQLGHHMQHQLLGGTRKNDELHLWLLSIHQQKKGPTEYSWVASNFTIEYIYIH